MEKGRKRTIGEIETALRDSGGFIAKAAGRLGMAQSSLSERIQRGPRLQAVLAEIVEESLDTAEEQLMGLIRGGNLGAICFLLKCKGKSRGYIERQEIAHSVGPGGSSIKIEFVD